MFSLLIQEVQDEKPIATPWLKEREESEEATDGCHPEPIQHTRAAVKAITDANFEAVSPPPPFIEKQPPSAASSLSFPVPTSTAHTTSYHLMAAHGRQKVVSEYIEDEKRAQQSSSDDSYKQQSPLIPPRYGPAYSLKRQISCQAAQGSHSLTKPAFFRSVSLQPEHCNIFGHNIKQVERVLQRMGDAIKMDLHHEA